MQIYGLRAFVFLLLLSASAFFTIKKRIFYTNVENKY